MTETQELPHNLDAEVAVLGAVMLDSEAIFRVLDVVDAEDFFRTEHRIIYETFIGMVESDTPIDLVTVNGALRESGKIGSVGGITYLNSLSDALPDVANVRHYARTVRDCAVRRSMIIYGRAVAAKAQGEGDVKAVMEMASEGLLRISASTNDGGPQKIVHSAKTVVSDFESLLKGDISHVGVRTGFSQLDNLVLMRNGRVIVVAGATSSGKSSLAFQMARQVAKADQTVVFFSLEMSSDELAARYLSAETNTDAKLIERGPATQVILDRLKNSLGQMSDTRLFVDDSVGLSPFDVRAKARQIQMQHGLDLVVIDYLQLMTYKGGGRLSREQEVSSLSRGVKLVAKSLGVPVMLLSQLSRRHQEEGRRPELRDLRESGSIENDADVVEMIYRPDLTLPEAELLVRKQRQGPLGTIQIAFDGSTQSFSEVGYFAGNLDDSSSGRQQAESDAIVTQEQPADFDEGDGIDW